MNAQNQNNQNRDEQGQFTSSRKEGHKTNRSSSGQFKKGSQRAKEAGRKGGQQ